MNGVSLKNNCFTKRNGDNTMDSVTKEDGVNTMDNVTTN